MLHPTGGWVWGGCRALLGVSACLLPAPLASLLPVPHRAHAAPRWGCSALRWQCAAAGCWLLAGCVVDRPPPSCPSTHPPPALMPAAWAENLLETAGPRFAGPIAIVRNWTYCLFYVMAELWGSVVVSVLFWGFANQVRLLACRPLWGACLGVLPAQRAFAGGPGPTRAHPPTITPPTYPPTITPPAADHHRGRGQDLLPPVRPGRQRGPHLLWPRRQDLLAGRMDTLCLLSGGGGCLHAHSRLSPSLLLPGHNAPHPPPLHCRSCAPTCLPVWMAGACPCVA